MSPVGAWAVERRTGTAPALHTLPEPTEPRRVARVLAVDAPAIVLGSTQEATVVDRRRADEAGVEVARRRSGGGAVLLVPGEHVWLDLFVPAGDDLWDDDVVAAAAWVGTAAARAAASLGVPDLSVHDGGVVASRWSSLVCFAGRGPGEVFRGDRKLVGLSQRRRRDWVRVQLAVHMVWDPHRTVELLALPPADREVAGAELATAVATVGPGGAAVAAALLAHLPG